MNKKSIEQWCEEMCQRAEELVKLPTSNFEPIENLKKSLYIAAQRYRVQKKREREVKNAQSFS